jgi:hypothetical protein
VFVSERQRTRGVEGMFERIRCFGLETRTLRVHVPAVPDSDLPGVTVSLQAGQSTYKGPGADGLQRPLRSRFRQQLRPGVDMTSDVKGCRQIFLGLHHVISLGASEKAEPAICDG